MAIKDKLLLTGDNLELNYPKVKIFGIPIPPGLARGRFLFASAAATLNFGKNEWFAPEGNLVAGVPEVLERYWGLLLICAGVISLIACLLPARVKFWHLFYRISVWFMLMAWLLTAFILTFASAYPSTVGVVLALCVALPSLVSILTINAEDTQKVTKHCSCCDTKATDGV